MKKDSRIVSPGNGRWWPSCPSASRPGRQRRESRRPSPCRRSVPRPSPCRAKGGKPVATAERMAIPLTFPQCHSTRGQLGKDELTRNDLSPRLGTKKGENNQGMWVSDVASDLTYFGNTPAIPTALFLFATTGRLALEICRASFRAADGLVRGSRGRQEQMSG